MVYLANEIRFDPVTYTVQEGRESVIFTVNGTTTFPLGETAQIRLASIDGGSAIGTVLCIRLLVEVDK